MQDATEYVVYAYVNNIQAQADRDNDNWQEIAQLQQANNDLI